MKRKFKDGQKVRISPNIRKELKQIAWSMWAVGGKEIQDRYAAEGYFVDMALGSGMKYTAEVIGYHADTKNFLVSVKLAGFERKSYFSADSLNKP